MQTITTEFYRIEKLANQPIIVVSILKSGASVKDIAENFDAIGTFLDQFGDCYLIATSSTDLKFTLFDVITAIQAHMKGGAGSASDKRIIEAVVANAPLVTRFFRDMVSRIPGKRHVPIFDTYEEAYLYICGRIELGQPSPAAENL